MDEPIYHSNGYKGAINVYPPNGYMIILNKGLNSYSQKV